MEDKDRFVNELLDSALAQQRAAKPRPGLEGRILQRVHATASERSHGRKTWRLWAAAAATAVVAVLIAIRVANRPHNPAPQISQAGNAVSAVSPTETLKAISKPSPATRPATKVVEPKRTARNEGKSSRRVETHHWPSQFPTPAPLSPEEKVLVRYVQETPPEVLAASLFPQLLESQPTEIKPVKISPIEIQPLTVRTPGEELQ